MNLARRDHKIIQLKTEIENNKQKICAKRRMLKNKERDNVYLKDVLDDYSKYNSNLISQKNKQIDFLKMIHTYIDNINTNITYTNNKLKNTELEQNDILNEIKILKNEINELIE